MDRTSEEEAEVQAMQDELLKPAIRGGGMDWIAKAASEICGHIHCEWLIEKSVAIIRRHYEASLVFELCSGTGKESHGKSNEECYTCLGTGKVVPNG